PPPPPRGGSTAVVLSLSPLPSGSLLATIANTGDSRLLLSPPGLPFSAVTVDHRPSSPPERARLRRAAAAGLVTVAPDSHRTLRLYPGGLAVSRTLGDLALTKACVASPEVFEREVDASVGGRWRFLLATDGVTDSLSNAEIASAIGEGGGAKEAARGVVREALEKCGLKDDLTHP
ncbi:hypothetical protein TeGR_g11359, partial [Tetraparma gracilis]